MVGKTRDSARTQRALLDAAREVFLRDGYAAAATEDIVALAGVTRGALYHHFADKRDLFRAVVEAIQQQAEDDLRPSGTIDDHWEAFTDAALGTLDAVDDPAIGKLLLIEAPAVLGWSQVRATHRHSAVTLTERAIRAAATEHGTEAGKTRALAHLLIAAIEEAMLYLAHSDDPTRDRPEVEEQLRKLLTAMRP